MKLLFALGNPGGDYVGTRHNTGFMAIDMLARELGASFSEKKKFHAYIAELTVAGNKVLLVKPTTFYNNVGISALSLIDFYKLNPSTDMLVVHDDLALPFGTIRVRGKGSDAGNNGVKSLNEHIGPEYVRLRIGISVAERSNDDASFVLSRFNGEEMMLLKSKILPKTTEIIQDFSTGNLPDTSFTIAPAL